jgi:multiple sugar transport system ATP-binding protein
MNFFDAKIIKSGRSLKVDAGSFKVDVPKDRNKAYTPYVDKDVIFGIRPEDIHDTKYTPPNIKPSNVDAEVDVVELMGNEIVGYLKSGTQNFVARVDPRSEYSLGEKVKVAFNVDNLHIFDKETEKAVR